MNFKINIGEFKHYIEIQKLVQGTDEENRPKEEWKTILKTRAKILNARGGEFLEAKGVGSKIAKTFYIRFSRSVEITNECRVLYNETPYNILYVNDIEERGIYLEIKTEHVD